jgi:imidazole glycerol-phosphate synthase subunit HisH
MAGDVIAVLDYGIGNLRSAEKALLHLGAPAVLTGDPEVVAAARGVVLPGVGAFGRCAERLRESGLDRPALAAIDAGTPFLGICVGMQLLFDGSDENPDVAGLGVFAGRVTRLPDSVTVPHMGWNTLAITPGSQLLAGLGESPWTYFVHSYAPEPTDAAVVAATTEHGRTIVAAVERGSVWATQFHPEKSSTSGLVVLANFAAACGFDRPAEAMAPAAAAPSASRS